MVEWRPAATAASAIQQRAQGDGGGSLEVSGDSGGRLGGSPYDRDNRGPTAVSTNYVPPRRHAGSPIAGSVPNNGTAKHIHSLLGLMFIKVLLFPLSFPVTMSLN